jgi:hypothetical protein
MAEPRLLERPGSFHAVDGRVRLVPGHRSARRSGRHPLLASDGRVRIQPVPGSWSRGWAWSRASGSCCTGPLGAGLAPTGRRPAFDLAEHFRVHRWPLRATRPSCWRPVRSCIGDGRIGPGRCGRRGCCPAC